MKWSQTYLYTLKENPSDADMVSHKLLIRSGFIRKLSQGTYTYGFLALKVLRKIEHLVRKFMNQTGGVEILMPITHPQSLWEETDRWEKMGQSLAKFKNRTGQNYCLGATHEEVITDYVRKDIKSYRDLPAILYQIQTKYRDEIRPRFGLIRAREFLMKDAYSFDLSKKEALKAYQNMKKAYEDLFKSIGLNVKKVKADSGAIGGDLSEEFHVLTDHGQDHLLTCGDFAANQEICPALDQKTVDLRSQKKPPLKEKETFATPHLKTIKDLSKFLKKPEQDLVKTLFYKVEDKTFCILLRGDDELNLIKLQKTINSNSEAHPLSPEEVLKLTKAPVGSCGPLGLKIPILMDEALKDYTNYTVGANKKDFHIKNVNHPRDFKPDHISDLRQAREGDLNPEGEGVLKKVQGIEIGHIFYLGEKYSQSMNLYFLNEKEEKKWVQMGCYGIGISRILQTTIEQSHDKDGMIWPLSICPFPVHICLLDPKDSKCHDLTNTLYEDLRQKGVDCFVDDRDERPGVKFKDADLLGFPFRLVIGKRSLESNLIEVVERKTKKMEKIPKEKLVDALLEKIH